MNFSLNCLKIQELQVSIKIQANFHSSQNTGENCHFTGNTGITGGRARPGIGIFNTSMSLVTTVCNYNIPTPEI